MGPLVNYIIQQIDKSLSINQWLGFPSIVAVSGGLDSVALLRFVDLIRQRDLYTDTPLIVAHVNHGLRGSESDEEETFVADLAHSMGLDFVVHRLKASNTNSEEQLRNERYQFLLQLARKSGARLVATAHNADDQVETILFRVFRGTGMGGLSGIPQICQLTSTVSLIRPLLHIRRIEIEQALSEMQQPFRVDSSNAECSYTRNFLRLKLIPEISSRFGAQFAANLIRLGQQATETEEFLNAEARKLFPFILTQSHDLVQIDCREFSPRPEVLLRQFFKLIWSAQNWPQQAMTFEKWHQLAELACLHHSSAIELPGKIRCEVSDQRLSFYSESPPTESTKWDQI